MKKELTIFLSNCLAMLLVIVSIINITPKFKSEISIVNKNIISAFNPVVNIKKEKSSITNQEKKVNTITTTQSSTQVFNRIVAKDSKVDFDITKTPEDIKALMDVAKKNIKNEKKKGKTTEKDYFGGGKRISYGNVEIQSKIPESFYNPDIEELLKKKIDVTLEDKSKPTILIYHTHTTESYTLLDVGYYTESLDLRSNDNSKNMVRVGDELTEYLKLKGYNVIHDTKIHDKKYTGAYGNSRKTVEQYLEKYPSIEVTIDVHRDDITYEDKTKNKPTAIVNGKKAAKMMIIAGAEYGTIKNYPNWEDNLAFDVDVTNKVNSMYPGLMRPILFAERKYNMDETKMSFLLEVGTDANTLDEACYSARLFGVALADLLDEKYLG